MQMMDAGSQAERAFPRGTFSLRYQPIQMPQTDSFDVLIIGAGVSGASIARKLSACQLDVALVDRECDVSFGTSKSNSGIIHAGFHHSAKHLKARLEIRGNAMFDQLQGELGFPFRRCGILVVATHPDEMKVIGQLYAQGVENGSVGIEMCSRGRMLELEPKLSPDVLGGLHAPSGGIIEPYRFVFCLVESALKNGVELLTDFKVTRGHSMGRRGWSARKTAGRSRRGTSSTRRGCSRTKSPALFGRKSSPSRRGKGSTFFLTDPPRACPSRVLFPVPTHNSKGVLVIPTVEGTVLVGPTATDTPDKKDLSTTAEELEKIFDYAKRLVPTISQADVITSFPACAPFFPRRISSSIFPGRSPNSSRLPGSSPRVDRVPRRGERWKESATLPQVVEPATKGDGLGLRAGRCRGSW